MAVETIPTKLELRSPTIYEEAAGIDFQARADMLESNISATTGAVVSDIREIETNVVNQVRRHKILSGRMANIRKITISDVKMRSHLLNAFSYMYLKGKDDARREVENSLGKRITIKGVSQYQEAVSLSPTDALNEFGRRQLVSKSEFAKMAGRERARAFTVAGIVEKDILNSARLLVSKGIDEGWSIGEFERGLREANVKYTGTVYGTDKRKGQPLAPFHTETIVRTNFSTVYNKGRWNLMNDPDVVEFVPAYEYSAILDSRTRRTHRQMDGRIYPRDDPIWLTWKVPAGYNCRCMLVPVTSNMSYSISNPVPATLRPDTGFGRAA